MTLRVFLHLTIFFELMDDLFSQSCLQAAEISSGMEKGSCLEGELFAGVLSRVHKRGRKQTGVVQVLCKRQLFEFARDLLL